MSKYETPLTEHFWQVCCNGAYIPEYRLVRKSNGIAERRADAVILPNEQHRRATRVDYPDLTGRDVVVVQTKANRLGMSVMGQALFSAQLIHRHGASSVRSIILVTAGDAVLEQLLLPFPDIEVWIADPSRTTPPRRQIATG
ncbi:hypothetical protein P1J78_19300 [Psychromarinibacter sp. C21-152]|uniref:Uncharacterized protein n=1 Tax=Psychromarinibacter sediminicola TaxID=3033385 RepID=A0AAE3NWD0_9RHOB|nr:hypothetical protein [Psychromarinibacter sediminicola]MDF0602894.1 hypothetical protein [Psychromarinibacter sediminicola]